MAGKRYGITRYLVKPMKDMYNYYNEAGVAEVLINLLRPITAQQFKADAVHKYPKLSTECACSLYAEDVLVEKLGLKHKRMIKDNKLVDIA